MKFITIIFAIGVLGIWLFNVKTLRQVTSLEKELKVANENLEKLEKELDKKIMYYDANLDLDKIRRDMEAKGMKVSDEVIYFEIEE
ncbi:LapA family protein [Fusobacterium hwasookii]|uniref:LapA family protein n=1 Tax=Fusobacterium hwasookii TaxID=1583098 RepID=UPI001624DA74|nr:LapA family protein [Fusobacterium hwasookii]QNE66167.1 LapA family protein [Fusobacterium hwasookii]